MVPIIEIVEIRLGFRPDGTMARDAPFLVIPSDDGDDRSAQYADEPAVIAQLAEHEHAARFEAIWDGEWRFGRRVMDA